MNLLQKVAKEINIYKKVLLIKIGIASNLLLSLIFLDKFEFYNITATKLIKYKIIMKNQVKGVP